MTDWADEAAEDILSDLNGRSGMSTSDIDDDIIDEIRATWASLIRGAAEKYEIVRPAARTPIQEVDRGMD